MAITALASAIRLPNYNVTANNPTINYSGAFYLNGASSTRVAYVFQAPVAGDLDTAEYLIGYAAGAAAVKVSFQDVDSSGNPDGTPDAYFVINSPTTGWISVQPTSTGAGGGSRKTVTRGQYVALVLEWNSTQSGFYEWHGLVNNSNPNLAGSTYGTRYSGSWSRDANGIYPNFAIKYADGFYYPILGPVIPLSSIAGETYANNNTPDECGIRIVVGTRIRVTGGWFCGKSYNAPYDLVLYDTDGTSVLASKSVAAGYAYNNDDHDIELQFSAAVELEAGSTYRLALKPTSTTSVTLTVNTVAAAGIVGAYPCGAEWHYTARTDAGAWSQTTTKRPVMGLIFDGVETTSAGGSGGSYAFTG